MNIKGFTLIELLMVIAILGVLATMVMFSVRNISPHTRDSRRRQDLDQIKNALEIYYTDHEGYPADITFGSALTAQDVDKTYMQKIPLDPAPTSYNYVYVAGEDEQSYTLYACIEDLESREGLTEIEQDCGDGCSNVCWYSVNSPGQ